MSAPVREVKVVVIGAGPAGLGAAARLGELGVSGVVVLDRERSPGGLPGQCEHRGFGILRYWFPLTGFEYARRLAERARRAGVEVQSETTVLRIEHDREVLAVSAHTGLVRHRAKAVIVATGCREQSRPQRAIAGTRPAGVFNTAVVQRLMNLHRILPGREVVIVGSEDVGLMLVRLLAKAGARVRAVVDETPYLQGYKANYLYSVFPFRVPLLLGFRVAAILGRDRVTGVEVERVTGGEPRVIPCDCVVLSGRFLPESTLSREAGIPLDPRTGGPRVDQNFQTMLPGIFACGNVLHYAEPADIALSEGEYVADAVAKFIDKALPDGTPIPLTPGPQVCAVVPQSIIPGSTFAWLLVRPLLPLLPAKIEVTCGRELVAQAWRPWAVPNRSLRMKMSVPARGLTEEFVVALRGRSRGGSQEVITCRT